MGAFRIDRMFHAVVVVGASLPGCGSRTELPGPLEVDSGARPSGTGASGANAGGSGAAVASGGGAGGGSASASTGALLLGGAPEAGVFDASALLGAVDGACAPSQIFCTDYVAAIGCECRLSSPTGPDACEAGPPFFCPYHCVADPYGCMCLCIPLIR